MSTKAARIFVIIVAVGLVVGAIAFGVRLVLPATNVSSIQPQLATASINSFPVVVAATGTVVPASETYVNFPYSGRLAQIDVTVGQSVSQGAPLATLDSASAQSAVSQAEANLASAQASLGAVENPLTASQQSLLQTALTNAEQVLTDTTSSVQTTNATDAQNIVSDQAAVQTAQTNFDNANCSNATTGATALCQSYQSQLTAQQHQLATDQARAQTDASAGVLRIDQAQGQVNSAKSNLAAAQTSNPSQVSAAQSAVSSAQAGLQAAQDRLANLTLAAPIAGTVLAINGQVGQSVSGSPTAGQSLPGTNTPVAGLTNGGGGNASPLFVIGTPGQLVVGFSFPSNDLSLISPGLAATVTGSTLNGLEIAGKILAVSSNPVMVSGVSSYYATFVPTSPSSQLTPGLSVNVTVAVSQVANALSVPVSAVYLLGGTAHVDVWYNNAAVPTAITIGAQGASLVQVKSGLRAGEQVLLVANQGFAQAGLP